LRERETVTYEEMKKEAGGSEDDLMWFLKSMQKAGIIVQLLMKDRPYQLTTLGKDFIGYSKE